MTEKLHIDVRKMCDDAELPVYASAGAAGCDLYACGIAGYNGCKVIYPGETVKIGTGICMEIPAEYFGAVFARSGLAVKSGLRPANCVGVIDSDYRGEITVALHNDSHEPVEIKNGDRIAQLVFIPCKQATFDIAEKISDTERGAGGFGSTGVGKENGFDPR